jgi:hypothetical protein
MKSIVFLPFFLASIALDAQNLGIGTSLPQAKLHVKSDFEALRLQGSFPYLTFYSNANVYRGYLFSYANNSVEIGTVDNLPVMISPSLNPAASFLANGNVGIGVGNPVFRLDVAGRMRLRHQGATAGTWFNNSLNNFSPAFVGMNSDEQLGFYGNPIGWGLLMNTATGNVRLGALPNDSKLSIENSGGIALEVSGAIKVSGPVRPAFQLVVGPGNQSDFEDGDAKGVIIDNPLSNGDPNAVILLMPVQFLHAVEIKTVYDVSIGKWKIRNNVNYMLSGINNASEMRTCSLSCTALLGYGTASKFFGFVAGDKFNVLIMNQ